jgi:hypothetical protein
MEKKKNYNLVIGLAALVAIVLIIAFVGYLVSKPKPHIRVRLRPRNTGFHAWSPAM